MDILQNVKCSIQDKIITTVAKDGIDFAFIAWPRESLALQL